MLNDVQAYFDKTVMPTVAAQHPDLLSQLGVMIVGSVGLGIADEFSDLEADFYLDEPLWKERGGQLQLSLNKCLSDTCPYVKEGSVLCVRPLSWLLGGHTNKFLTCDAVAPWEEIRIEELFALQNNLIIWDPQSVLNNLRDATAPGRFPGALWAKRLIVELKKLVSEDLPEFRSCVRRGKTAEAQILFGVVLEGLFHTGFVINRQYYPWRTHLRWAFKQLPSPTSEVLSCVDAAASSPNWQERLKTVEQVFSIYRQQISETNALPTIDLDAPRLGEELVWAERLRAWENPNWRDWIRRCEEKAIQSGYPDSEFWVWSLWGWAQERANRQSEATRK